MSADETRSEEQGAPGFTIEEVDADKVRPLRHRHLRPDQPADAVAYKSDECPTCRHFAATDTAGEVIGVATMHFSDRMAGQPPFKAPGMRIRGMAVEDEWRGKGVGAGLVARMLKVALKAGIVEAWANARTLNRRFYARNGFSEVSSPFEIPTMGEHIVVARSVGKAAKPPKRAKKAGKKASKKAKDGDGAEA